MDTLWRKQNIVTRSLSAENPTGEHGMGGRATEGSGSWASRELGVGWKVSPFADIPAKSEKVIADIKGPGMIKHMWIVPLDIDDVRFFILRIYYDGCEKAAVECPVGDFFASPNIEYNQISSLLVCRNPNNAYNCYFEMPFKKSCKITMENLNEKNKGLAYQIDYEEREIPEDALYFHAQFRRDNPLPYKQDYTILDTVKGKGCYVGVSMLWGIPVNGWWGEGEIKFFMDGDRDFPTICGTGTEDYFCGSYNFDVGGKYIDFSTPYTGFYHWKTDGVYKAANRFSMYRWHVTDPVYFEKDLRVTIQSLGWRCNGRYLPLQADISSVAYFYLDAPCADSRPLPDADGLEIC
ncbi:MAG: DUF2961 domain-containing protein [Clostridia bacterium]|nr:DUF2961 domain-containing protein [Clostridia bacterium]